MSNTIQATLAPVEVEQRLAFAAAAPALAGGEIADPELRELRRRHSVVPGMTTSSQAQLF